MRRGALALLLFATACGQEGSTGNRAAPSGNSAGLSGIVEQRQAAATLTLAASGPGGCSARWEGQPATPQQVLERSSALIEQGIERAGGVESLTDATTPAVGLRAPAGLGFACVDSFLAAVRRAGVPSVLFALENGDESALADFTLSDIGAPPPSVVIVAGGGGGLTWNGQAIALDAIAGRVRELGGGDTAIEAPPGEVELRPAREATFGQVHAALRAVRAGRFRAALLLPSVQPSRPPAPAPRPAAPPPAAGNTSAPRR